LKSFLKVRNNYFVYIDSVFQELFKQIGINGRITKCEMTETSDLSDRYTIGGGVEQVSFPRFVTTLHLEAIIDGIPQKVFEPRPRVYERIEKKEYSIKDIESLINAFAIALDEKSSKQLREDLANWKNLVLSDKGDELYEIKF
jgi:hypothetical protein